MHELSLARAIVDIAAAHAPGHRVARVDVRIGRLRQVVPRSLEFYFGVVSRNTACDGAELRHTVVPALLSCRGCGCEWELEVAEFRCPACGTGEIEIMCGEELEVESIEVEEEACTAPR